MSGMDQPKLPRLMVAFLVAVAALFVYSLLVAAYVSLEGWKWF
jgi:hypothetical protein